MLHGIKEFHVFLGNLKVHFLYQFPPQSLLRGLPFFQLSAGKLIDEGKVIVLSLPSLCAQYFSLMHHDGAGYFQHLSLGSQAKTILVSHLQQTNRFIVLDRENMGEIRQEAEFAKRRQSIQGARYVITGDVSEFGRKEVGDHQLFGILGRGKQQVAYAKVTLNVIDVDTSQVVHSASGAGEYSLSNREVIGFGGTASYDSTLNSKVLDLAIRQAVDALVAGIESGAWPINN